LNRLVDFCKPARSMKGMTESLIDVWNVETFDQYLLAELRANAELIRNYIVTERNNFLEREASDRRGPYPTNPYAASYLRFLEDVGRDMEARTIRAWHYTRLTDAETDTLRNTGIYASTLETIRRRLDAQVAAGVFSAEIADALFAQSPFHRRDEAAFGIRRDKILNFGLVLAFSVLAGTPSDRQSVSSDAKVDLFRKAALIAVAKH
jgi:hypothetical protein